MLIALTSAWRHLALRAAALPALLALSGPLAPPAAAAAPRVVAADGVLCDLTRTVAREDLEVICLQPAGRDPHLAALRPSDRQQLASAELVLINGYGLTPALNKVSGRGRRIAVAEQAVPESPSLERGGARDPHVWHDPRQTAAMVSLLARSLAPLSRQDAALNRRSQEARAVLRDLDAWSERQIAGLPAEARVLASGHRAFLSLARRYGLRDLAVIESFSTAGLMRPQGLEQASAALRRSGARVIFADQLPPPKALRRIAQRSGIPIAPQALSADGLAPNRHYVATFSANVCAVVKAQGGSCDSAAADRLAARWSAIR
ncbi:MAG: metal ABC transporter substrate-binding protein [Synechococcaceae cyanobacterium]|nr:metal ABC transporter substrate-binding protein [Synechococcaceae cyanobacterium]